MQAILLLANAIERFVAAMGWPYLLPLPVFAHTKHKGISFPHKLDNLSVVKIWYAARAVGWHAREPQARKRLPPIPPACCQHGSETRMEVQP
jgi:hypothetical protein